MKSSGINHIIISLLFAVFLTSCATHSAGVKKSHEVSFLENSINTQPTVITEKQDTIEQADETESFEDIQELIIEDSKESIISLDNVVITDMTTDLNRIDSFNKQVNEDTENEELQKIKTNIRATNITKTNGDDDLIKEELKRIMLEFGEDVDEVPQVFLEEVKGYINTFQTNPEYRNFVIKTLERSTKYMPFIKAHLGERGIPEDMAYIAFIESGFNPRAISHAGAAGVWQFMPKTAVKYSLKVNRRIDERFDPVKSTYAAVDYFHDLIAIFGPRSFLLALAAYNSGEGKIITCLREIDNPFEQRNFWHIRPCLAEETRKYPPKVIAAAIIGNNPDAFGFPKFEGVEEEIIKPAVLVKYEPDYEKEIPQPSMETGNKKEKSVIAKKPVRKKVTKKAVEPKPVIYTAKTGNTLTSIASAFNVGTGEIKKWNRLKSDKILAGMKLKIFPKSSLEMVRYTVKKRDTVSEISEYYGVRPSHIISCNGMTNGWDIKAGQTLTFYKKVKKKAIIYTVKKGSNLTYISEAYNVDVDDIMEWNNLSSTVIHPGQKLKIYPEGLRNI